MPDGTIYRALEKLLVLDGERISYRALDVEQIGSVYETMMGFRLETATRPLGRDQGAGAATVHRRQSTWRTLLAVEPAKRAKWLQDHADRKLTGKSAAAVKDASHVDGPARRTRAGHRHRGDARPSAAGAMVLQPSEERRRSGSHYTPRSLTEPIVRDTLQPVLDRLR